MVGFSKCFFKTPWIGATISLSFVAVSIMAQPDTTSTRNPELKSLIEVIERVADKTKNHADGFKDDEFDKLIFNETITKAGNDFQELFYRFWSWPQHIDAPFVILISERPFRFNTTFIKVSVNDQKVFERALQPRYDMVEELAKAAVSITSRYIGNYNSIIKQLEGGDQEGTGIY